MAVRISLVALHGISEDGRPAGRNMLNCLNKQLMYLHKLYFIGRIF
jgi:hypothetical protein